MTVEDENDVPLCIDLDGSLVRTDLLYESFFSLLKHAPLYLFFVPFWLLKGKAYLKKRVAEKSDVDVTSLPYHSALLEYLRSEKKRGRELALATASTKKIADGVAEHLGLFNRVFASEEDNLSGRRKRDKLVEVYGEKDFDYVGNSTTDLDVWSHARSAIVVGSSRKLVRQAERLSKVEKVFEFRQNRVKDIIRAIRVHQWAKNSLLCLPVVTSHQFDDLPTMTDVLIAFIAFSLCASSVYLLNDLIDLPSDRHHPRKRNRPLAAGDMSVSAASLLFPCLLVVAFSLATLLPIEFLGVLALYYAITLNYSVWIKRLALVDVVTLASLFTIRMLAGGAASGISPSFWLIAFAVFLFLSLAVVKRYAELLDKKLAGETVIRGRGYEISDLPFLGAMGIAAGYGAVMVFALYVNSAAVTALYSQPSVLWFAGLLLLLWISHIWLRTTRGTMHDDPVVFAVKDRGSLFIGALVLCVFLLAK